MPADSCTLFDLDVARIERERERDRGGEGSGTEKREIQTVEIISRVAWDGLIKIVNRSTDRVRGRGNGNEFFHALPRDSYISRVATALVSKRKLRITPFVNDDG